MPCFSAADGGNQLVIQSCSSVTDGISTGSSRYWSNSAHRVITNIDNEEPVLRESCCKVQTLITDTVGPVPIYKNRPAPIELQWTGCGSESVLRSVLTLTSSHLERDTLSPFPTLLMPLVSCWRHLWHWGSVLLARCCTLFVTSPNAN